MRANSALPLVWSLVLAGLTLGPACKETPYIDPSRYGQAANPTFVQRPRLFARATATAEPLPDALTADALQLGWMCLDLPRRPRPQLLPSRGDGVVRVVQRNALATGWEVMAVDLASRTATVEAALPGWQVEPAGDMWVVLAVPPTASEDPEGAPGALQAADAAPRPQPTVDLALPATELGSLVALAGGVTADLAAGATDVESAVVDAQGSRAWFVRMPGAETPTVWQVSLPDPATPVLVGEAEHLWAVANDGLLLVIRGHGAAGPETQLLNPATGQRWRIGPDAKAVLQAADRVILQDRDDRLWAVGNWPGGELPLPWSSRGDALLTAGGRPALARQVEPGKWQFLWIDRSQLVSVGTLGPARWLAGLPMHGGVVLALLGHDTNCSGSVDPRVDEVDVCVVAQAVLALDIPARKEPAREGGWPGPWDLPLHATAVALPKLSTELAVPAVPLPRRIRKGGH